MNCKSRVKYFLELQGKVTARCLQTSYWIVSIRGNFAKTSSYIPPIFVTITLVVLPAPPFILERINKAGTVSGFGACICSPNL